jgi:uncharacterized protein HemY
MLPPAVRLVLVIAALAAGALVLASGRWSGIVFLVAAGLLIWGHYRVGPVRRAYSALDIGKSDLAARLIEKVRSPERLKTQERAQYHYVVGILAGERGDMTTAEQNLELAMGGPRAKPNDRAQVACWLAELALGRGDSTTARRQLDRAREIEHDGEVAKTIAEIEDLLDDDNPGDEPK